MFVIENKTFHKTVYITCKIVRAIFVVTMFLFMAWFVWSVVEVWVHNMTMLSSNPYQYSDINLFQLLVS